MCEFETGRSFHSDRASWDRPVSGPEAGRMPLRAASGGAVPNAVALLRARVNDKATVSASKRTFLISYDKRRGAPDLWAHFTGH